MYAVAANAEPSVVNLDYARDALDRLRSFVDEYVDALTTAARTTRDLKEKASLARQSLHRAIDTYARLPFFSGEKALYDELRGALQPVDLELDALLSKNGAGDAAAARATLEDRLRPELDRVDEAIARIIDFDTHEVHERLAAIQTYHRRATKTGIALGSFSLALSCVASILALRAVMREASRQVSVERERATRAAAEATVRARDDFLALAAHELRTPLTSLRLTLQMAQRAPVCSTETLARADSQARRLSELVEELILTALINLGQLRPEPSDVNLTALVREVAESYAVAAERAGVTFTVLGEPSVVGRWDRTLAARIVANLLSNAMKFGAFAPIEIIVSRRDGAAQLTVRDHGIGIPQSRLPFVFERFERAVPIHNFPGLGLGLFVVRGLVEAHGGSIHVESEPGAGATFTIALPLGGVAA